jgi:maleylpyruvate isomerase
LSLELYSYWRSSASYRVRIALNLKALPYSYHGVDLLHDGGDQWKAPYKGVNPQSRVPTLVHDGLRISQSLAIIEYLEETFHQPALLPRDPADRAHVRMLSQIIACDVQPMQNTSTTRYLKDTLHHDDATIGKWMQEWIVRGLDAYDAHLARDPVHGKFSHGDTPTMADCCLVPQVFNGQRFDCDFSGLPRTMAAFEACMQLDAFQRAQPSRCPDAEA